MGSEACTRRLVRNRQTLFVSSSSTDTGTGSKRLVQIKIQGVSVKTAPLVYIHLHITGLGCVIDNTEGEGVGMFALILERN